MSGNPTLTGLFNCQAGQFPYTFSQIDTANGAYEDYKVHYNKVHRLRNNVGVTYQGTVSATSDMINPYFNFHIKKKKLNMTSDYSRGNTAGVTDFETNSYYILFITDTNEDLTILMDLNMYFQDA